MVGMCDKPAAAADALTPGAGAPVIDSSGGMVDVGADDSGDVGDDEE